MPKTYENRYQKALIPIVSPKSSRSNLDIDYQIKQEYGKLMDDNGAGLGRVLVIPAPSPNTKTAPIPGPIPDGYPHNVALTTYFRLMVSSPKTRIRVRRYGLGYVGFGGMAPPLYPYNDALTTYFRSMVSFPKTRQKVKPGPLKFQQPEDPVIGKLLDFLCSSSPHQE
ncbi:hypothetical protein LXL04_030456 [Taraxacum kok-saghyz]